METQLDRWKGEAREYILDWMQSQRPAVTRQRLGELLEYRRPSSVTRGLDGEDAMNEAFIYRLARVPDLAWIANEYHETFSEGAKSRRRPAEAKQRAKDLRELAELERQAVEIIHRICEAAKRRTLE